MGVQQEEIKERDQKSKKLHHMSEDQNLDSSLGTQWPWKRRGEHWQSKNTRIAWCEVVRYHSAADAQVHCDEPQVSPVTSEDPGYYAP